MLNLFLKIMFLYTIRYIIPVLPHSLLMKIADLTGSLNSKGEKAAITKEQVRKMFGNKKPESELDQIVLCSLRNFHKDLFEIWCFPRLTKEKMARIAKLDGREHINKALKKGKGVLIAVTHFGSWKIIIPAIAFAGYPTHQVAVNPLNSNNEKETFINKKIMEIEYLCEKSLPVQFIYIGRFMRKMYRALAKNEVVIVSLDGIERRKDIKINVLQKTIGLDVRPIEFAVRSNIPLLPTFAIRENDNHHRIVVYDELKTEGYCDSKAAIKGVLAEYASILERHVIENPSHYARSFYVFETIWRSRLNTSFP